MQKMAVVVFLVFVILLTGHVTRAEDTPETTTKAQATTTLNLMQMLDMLFGTTQKPPATTTTTTTTTTKPPTMKAPAQNPWQTLMNTILYAEIFDLDFGSF
ncbi:hypothetical protein ACOMHN_036615 [Nucella lapillus]